MIIKWQVLLWLNHYKSYLASRNQHLLIALVKQIEGAKSKSDLTDTFTQLCHLQNADTISECDRLHLIALFYEQGLGITVDMKRAISIYEDCHGLKHYYSSVRLSNYHSKSNEVTSQNDCFTLLLNAFKNECKIACYYIGFCYENGIGVNNSPADAVKYYQMAIENQDSNGSYALSRLLLNGIGIEKDIGKAVQLIKSAAEQGHGGAQLQLAVWYEKGLNLHIEVDLKQARELLQKAASGKHANALFRLGLYYEQGILFSKDLTKAQTFYETACQQGHKQAQLKLGIICFKSSDDKSLKGFNYLLPLAAQGNVIALYYIGLCHYIGVPHRKDLKAAMDCFKLAGDAGDHLSLVKYAKIREEIAENPKVEAQEFVWHYKPASLRHNVEAMLALSRWKLFGYGLVKPNKIKCVLLLLYCKKILDEHNKFLSTPRSPASAPPAKGTLRSNSIGNHSLDLDCSTSAEVIISNHDQYSKDCIALLKEMNSENWNIDAAISLCMTIAQCSEIKARDDKPKGACLAPPPEKMFQPGLNLPEALDYCGFIYQYGLLGKNDPKQAIDCYQKAIEMGHFESHWDLLDCFKQEKKKLGKSFDSKKILEWYETRANKNDIIALIILANHYECGVLDNLINLHKAKLCLQKIQRITKDDRPINHQMDHILDKIKELNVRIAKEDVVQTFLCWSKYDWQNNEELVARIVSEYNDSEPAKRGFLSWFG